MAKYNILIAGCTGYIGLQLVKLLIKHNGVRIKYLCGSSSIGRNINFYDKTIKKKLPKITKFKSTMLNDVDIIFTALPNGEAQKISRYLKKHNTLIDLSGDFRINKELYQKWYNKKHMAPENIQKSIYSLPEITNEKLKKYQIISCPGCYPTSILLPLVPLIENKLIYTNNIIIDSKSGYSGAGRGVHKKFKTKNLYESLSVYGIGFHKHNPEIESQLLKKTNEKIEFNFTPHLSPMFRGILTTIYVNLKKNYTQKTVTKYLKKFYKNDYFINIKENNENLSTNDVINTNYCNISISKTKYKNKLVIVSVIDNLIKGGSGQAVQNMNKKFNFSTKKGLT